MSRTRRFALLSLAASALVGTSAQDPQDQNSTLPRPPSEDDDLRLPNGKSQKDAIAKQNHEQALKDANDLVTAAEQLRDELQKAGNFVVPLASVKKTEEIEKLAKRIRG